MKFDDIVLRYIEKERKKKPLSKKRKQELEIMKYYIYENKSKDLYVRNVKKTLFNDELVCKDKNGKKIFLELCKCLEKKKRKK